MCTYGTRGMDPMRCFPIHTEITIFLNKHPIKLEKEKMNMEVNPKIQLGVMG